MYPSRSTKAPLYRYFAGLAESTFESRLGVADPALVDYLSELLVRFVRCDSIYSVRNLAGQRLQYVVDMLAEAEARTGEARREVHRQIGDFTLFWTGVYPEALKRSQSKVLKDHFLDYCEHGKRAYFIASTMRNQDNADECDVLERLSHEFELCVYGLSEVRREWERRDGEGHEPGGPLLIN